MINLDINSMYPHTVAVTIETPKFLLIESSPDSTGVMWHEIAVNVASLQRWIESQHTDLWCDGTYTWGSKNTGIPYLVHESLYTYISLRWS